MVGPAIVGSGEKLGNALAGNYNSSTDRFERDPLEVARAIGDTVGTAMQIGAPGAQAEILGNVLGRAGKALPASAAAIQDGLSAIKSKMPIVLGGPISDPEGAWTSALRPGTNIPTWQQSVKIAPDLIKDAESEFGRPIESVHDLLPQIGADGGIEGPGAIQIAKGKLNYAKDQIYKNSGSQGIMVDGNKIADAKIASISQRQRLLDPEGVKEEIDNINSTYRKPWSVSDAEALKQGAQAENNTLYAKGGPNAKALLKADPKVASLNAESKAWGDAINDTFDNNKVLPQDQGKLQQINKQWGALNDFEKAAWSRKNVLDRQAVETLPQQLTKVQSIGTAVTGAGKVAAGVVGLPFTHGLSAAYAADGLGDMFKAVAGSKFMDHIKEATGTNGLIKRVVAQHDLSGFDPVTVSPSTPQAVAGQGLLGPASGQFEPSSSSVLGSKMGDVTDTIPSVNPLTGKTEYIPNPSKNIHPGINNNPNPHGPYGQNVNSGIVNYRNSNLSDPSLPKGIRALLGPATGGPSIPSGVAPLITTPPGYGFEMGQSGVRNIKSASQSGLLNPQPIPSEYSAPSQARYIGSSSDINKIPKPIKVKLPNGKWQNIK